MDKNVITKVKTPSLARDVLGASLELIPFVSSLRCCREAQEIKDNPPARMKKLAEAALWGGLDAITLAAFVVPALGVSLELGLAGSKSVRFAGKLGTLANVAAPIIEKIPQALAVANTAQNVYPFARRVAPRVKQKLANIKQIQSKQETVGTKEPIPAVAVETPSAVLPRRHRTRLQSYKVLLLKKLPRNMKRAITAAAKEIDGYIKPVRTMSPKKIFSRNPSPTL